MYSSTDKAGEIPSPISASEAAFLLPPPSYQEVMGVYQTSVKSEQSNDMPPLSYIDIMPRCLKTGNIKGKIVPTFDNFSAIMEGANRWLREHPGLLAWKCETVIRRIGTMPDGSLTYDLNDMLRTDPSFGFVVFIRGLRLWLTKNTNPGSTPQQLGLRNEVPEKKEILVLANFRRRGYMIGSAGIVIKDGVPYHKFLSFKNLNDTLDRVNEKLAADPLPGTILTVETEYIKSYESFQNELDAEKSCWSEDKSKFKRVTQVIRMFYILGTPAKETIGIKDFVPDITEKGESAMREAKFENFEKFKSRIGTWLPSNQGIRIVNIQQNDVTVDKVWGGDVKVSPDCTDETISTFGDRRVVQTFRLVYVKSSVGAPPAPFCVTSRLFTPARTGQRSFETMTQTMDRVDAWLKITGVSILSVCTVEKLFNEHREEGMDDGNTDYRLASMSGKKWLTAIRVFFPVTYQEPDPSQLPPKPVFKTGSGACNIL